MINAAMKLATITLLFVSTAAMATDPTTNCESSKLKESSRYSACRFKTEAKAVARGVTPDYSKCDAKFYSNFPAAEDKAGPSTCPSEGDVDDIKYFLDACGAAVSEALSGAQLVTDVGTCNLDLSVCEIDLESCKEASAGVYSIGFVVTAPDELGTLQIQTNYAAAPGYFVGSGANVACAQTFGNLDAHNDIDGSFSLISGWIAANGATGPILMTVCDFAATAPPLASDFSVTVTDATNTDGDPISPTIAVTVAKKL